ncbi:hypothetical protein FRC02_003327 [Tulasnella sp. 418]|nr:hypothetical protein FRC02_003327 [Tulasnella sp. 418]
MVPSLTYGDGLLNGEASTITKNTDNSSPSQLRIDSVNPPGLMEAFDVRYVEQYQALLTSSTSTAELEDLEPYQSMVGMANMRGDDIPYEELDISPVYIDDKTALYSAYIASVKNISGEPFYTAPQHSHH